MLTAVTSALTSLSAGVPKLLICYFSISVLISQLVGTPGLRAVAVKCLFLPTNVEAFLYCGLST